MTEAVEIADICAVLDKLGASEVLPASSAKACRRGSYLLMTFRQIVLTGGSDNEVVAKLRDVLVKNQEG